MQKNNLTQPESHTRLVQNIKQLIADGKRRVASQVNQTLVITYWHIGQAINQAVLQNNRAEYGKTVMRQLAQQLQQEYGNGFSYANLTRMTKLYSLFQKLEIVATVSQQLSWSHFVELLKVSDDLKRDFYISMCRHEQWSVRVLRERIDSMLYERTALAKQPEKLIRQELQALDSGNSVTPEIFIKDPYLLDFLSLGDTPNEKDLELAILREIEHFILEFGSDFAFLSRQKRLQIGGNDYYLDLLFFHRTLRRLVVIELKLGEFKPEYKGQVELYLKWLEKHERQEGEKPPIAIILCAGKDNEVVELLDLDKQSIHIAEYWLKLPSKTQLQHKLQDAVTTAKLRKTQQQENDEN